MWFASKLKLLSAANCSAPTGMLRMLLTPSAKSSNVVKRASASVGTLVRKFLKKLISRRAVRPSKACASTFCRRFELRSTRVSSARLAYVPNALATTEWMPHLESTSTRNAWSAEKIEVLENMALLLEKKSF